MDTRHQKFGEGASIGCRGHVSNMSKAIALQGPSQGKSLPPLLQALIWSVIMLDLFSAWSICNLLEHKFFILSL